MLGSRVVGVSGMLRHWYFISVCWNGAIRKFPRPENWDLANSTRPLRFIPPCPSTKGWGPLNTIRPLSSGYRLANPDDPLGKVRQLHKKVEDGVEIYAQPPKPHLPTVGHFPIVVMFTEDSIRILTQWSDQLWYLQK